MHDILQSLSGQPRRRFSVFTVPSSCALGRIIAKRLTYDAFICMPNAAVLGRSDCKPQLNAAPTTNLS
jgi:hypothetical protein